MNRHEQNWVKKSALTETWLLSKEKYILKNSSIQIWVFKKKFIVLGSHFSLLYALLFFKPFFHFYRFILNIIVFIKYYWKHNTIENTTTPFSWRKCFWLLKCHRAVLNSTQVSAIILTLKAIILKSSTQWLFIDSGYYK